MILATMGVKEADTLRDAANLHVTHASILETAAIDAQKPESGKSVQQKNQAIEDASDEYEIAAATHKDAAEEYSKAGRNNSAGEQYAKAGDDYSKATALNMLATPKDKPEATTLIMNAMLMFHNAYGEYGKAGEVGKQNDLRNKVTAEIPMVTTLPKGRIRLMQVFDTGKYWE